MEIIDQLSVALGFATLAGLNLYLTVLIAGLAIRFNWIALADQYEQLTALGHPAVIAAASVFFLAEFFSDKIPWVDSAWDTVHTLIRPVGGALLAMKTLGATDPAFEVIIALLAGSATLVTHGVKASTRLAVNTSPEPVSNIVVSTAEDTAVVGGLALMAVSPLIAGIVFAIFLAVALYLTPKFFRRTRVFGWLLLQKLSAPAEGDCDSSMPADKLDTSLSSNEQLELRIAIGSREPDVRWVANCIIGRTKGFPGFTPQTFGKLVAENSTTDSTPVTIRFIGRRSWRQYHAEIPLAGLTIRHQSRVLSEDILIGDIQSNSKRLLVLRLPRGQRAIARKVTEQMQQLQSQSIRDHDYAPDTDIGIGTITTIETLTAVND